MIYGENYICVYSQLVISQDGSLSALEATQEVDRGLLMGGPAYHKERSCYRPSNLRNGDSLSARNVSMFLYRMT